MESHTHCIDQVQRSCQEILRTTVEPEDSTSEGTVVSEDKVPHWGCRREAMGTMHHLWGREIDR